MLNYYFEPAVGFSVATISSGALWLADTAAPLVAQAMGPESVPLIQTGGTVGLIGGLVFGCITLWRANREQAKDMAELNKEIRSDWKEQNNKLIAVLEKLDPSNGA